MEKRFFFSFFDFLGKKKKMLLKMHDALREKTKILGNIKQKYDFLKKYQSEIL